MGSEIKIRFKQSLHLSADLSNIAQELGQLSEGLLLDTIEETKGICKSVTSRKITDQEEIIRNSVAKDSQRLSKLSEEIHYYAQRMYQSEIENHELAQVRGY